MLVALIGVDAAGKTTQIQRLIRHYRGLGKSVQAVRLSSKPTVRNLLQVGRSLGGGRFDPLAGLSPNHLATGYNCDFFNHYCRNILPLFESDINYIFSDRYVLCYEAYAFAVGATCELANTFLRGLVRQPDLQILLDIDYEVSINRILSRPEERAIDETEDILRRLISFYRGTVDHKNVIGIDASGSIEDVTVKLIDQIDRYVFSKAQ